MSNNQGGQALAETNYEHINIMEIDPSYKPIPAGMYNLQINKLTPRLVTPNKGKNAGKEVLVLNGSFTVVNEENYSGRKLWQSFWASNPVDLKDLRRIADATGVTQVEGQTLSEYALTFENLNPPAEFKVPVDIEKAWQSEEDVNKIKFNGAQPV
jgi:hypothetical protein